MAKSESESGYPARGYVATHLLSPLALLRWGQQRRKSLRVTGGDRQNDQDGFLDL